MTESATPPAETANDGDALSEAKESSRLSRFLGPVKSVAGRLSPGWGVGRSVLALARLVARPASVLVLGALAVLVLGVASIHLGLGPFISAQQIENRLQRRAEAALGRAILPWADVAVDGRTARISGEAPDPIIREEARYAVANAAGSRIFAGIGRVDLRGVTTLSSVRPTTPFTLTIRRAAEGVSLAGIFNDAQTLQEIEQAFTRRGAMIVSAEVASTGRPPGDASRRAAVLAARALAFLNTGEAQLSPDALRLRGVAQTASDASTARAIIESTPGAFATDVLVTVAAAPEQDSTAEVCRNRLAGVSTRLAGAFRPGEATTTAAADPAFEALATAAQSCGSFPLRIEAHVFDAADPEAASAVSQARADAVVEALVARGMPPGRLAGVGYGDWRPLDPIGPSDGDTRIEIVIADGP